MNIANLILHGDEKIIPCAALAVNEILNELSELFFSFENIEKGKFISPLYAWGWTEAGLLLLNGCYVTPPESVWQVAALEMVLVRS